MEIDNKEPIDKIELQNNLFNKLVNDGGLKVESIIEIQYMMELIKYVPENYKDKQEQIVKCFELIINLANKYLEIYSKSIINTTEMTVE